MRDQGESLMNFKALLAGAAMLSFGAGAAHASTVFNVTATVVDWTAPKTANYSIAALGAQGGSGYQSGGANAGLGARVSGVFKLKAGDNLKIAVGEMGGNVPGLGPSAHGAGGGGGGGSFNDGLVQVAASGANAGDGYVTIDRLNTSVPEPAAWSLMLVGFGLVGLAMRRRSDRLATA